MLKNTAIDVFKITLGLFGDPGQIPEKMEIPSNEALEEKIVICRQAIPSPRKPQNPPTATKNPREEISQNGIAVAAALFGVNVGNNQDRTETRLAILPPATWISKFIKATRWAIPWTKMEPAMSMRRIFSGIVTAFLVLTQTVCFFFIGRDVPKNVPTF